MIIRLMGEGQYRVPDELTPELEQLDQQSVQAVEQGDEARLQAALAAIGETVRGRGQRLHDAHLQGSDLIIPPADLSLDEARRLFAEEGLIPELPTPS